MTNHHIRPHLTRRSVGTHGSTGPLGIRSAPEVFQRKEHELIQGMPQVEVVPDDFVVVGCREQVVQDHDKNLMAFLQLGQDHGLKLKMEKLKLRQVSFIGHSATAERLRADPAILNMPALTDKVGVQRLLDLVQNLSKFLPNLADVTKLSR